MKTVVVSIDGMMSVCDGLGVEKRLMTYPGIRRVEANFLGGTATVEYDESRMTLADVKKLVSECSYHCAGEHVPAHIIKSSDPPHNHSVAHYDKRKAMQTQSAMAASRCSSLS
jgi:Cu2+-exporting ATPase